MSRGRPQWQPSDQDRRQVQAMSAYGIPHADIANVLGVSPMTLCKHCREELDNGATRANSKVAEFLYTGILGSPTKLAFEDEKSRVTAAMFWLKTRAQWKETHVTQIQELPPEESVTRKAINDGLAKLALRRDKKPDPDKAE